MLSKDASFRVSAIECGLLQDNVVATDQYGEYFLTTFGKFHEKTGVRRDEPGSCPLRIDVETRTLSDFKNCGSCALSTIVFK